MSEEKIVAVEDESNFRTRGRAVHRLDSQLIVVAADETESVAIAETTEIAPTSGIGATDVPENVANQTESSRGGPTGPKTLRGKKKTRLNALTHGIFAVGIIPSRESEADYLQNCRWPIRDSSARGQLGRPPGRKARNVDVALSASPASGSCRSCSSNQELQGRVPSAERWMQWTWRRSRS